MYIIINLYHLVLGIVMVVIVWVVGFTTTCAISDYHHKSCKFESSSWRGVLNTTLCDKICQWLAAGRWFSPGTRISFTYATDHHDITAILLKCLTPR